jgi:3-deoxy-D-manno-octulosonate 8-phosphate phosphatase (KDO 8-P phosphatase)
MIAEDYFKGEFITDVSTIQQKLKKIKAFIFDWDGVFNDGRKDINGNSSFSEVDSMGVNMMRFSYYLLHDGLPVSVILTGENNKLAISFAQRESFHAVFYKTSDKKKGLDFLCGQYNIAPDEVLFVFDDVLDFSVAKLAGARFMIGRTDNVLLRKFAIDNNLVDYMTFNNGRDHAVREVSELAMMLQNNFNETIENRMHFSDAYKTYLQLRNTVTTQFFITKNSQIIEDINL